MKRLYSAVAALIGGCVLWWLGVYLSGFLAALTWPAFVLALHKSGSSEAVVHLGGTLGFIPMFLATGAAGHALFRVVGASAGALIAAVLPYMALNWSMGSFEGILDGPFTSNMKWLVFFEMSAFALGLFVLGGWRAEDTWPLPRTGQPPPGFAVRVRRSCRTLDDAS